MISFLHAQERLGDDALLDYMHDVQHWFERFSTSFAGFAGRPPMLFIALALSVIGVLAYLSNSEHFLAGASLAISALTLLLLPVLQASQNRDGAALQAKIDELLKVHAEARNSLIGIEKRTHDEIEQARCDEERGAR